MTQLAADTFTRANQASWGLASDGVNTWAVLAGTAANFTIVSNEGQFTGSTALNMMALGAGTAADCNLLVRFTSSAVADNEGVILRCDGTVNNFYRFRIKSGTIFITKTVAGTTTDLTSTAFTLVASTFYWIRARAFKSQLSMKIWQDGSTEPGAWTLTTADTALASAGRYGVFVVATATAHILDFDHFTATDISTKSAPMRVLVRTQITQSSGVRVLIRTQKTLSVGLRALIATQKTLSLVLRILVRTQITKVVGVRMIVRGITKVAGVRIPTRSQSSKTSALRSLVRTQHSPSAQLRIIVIAPPPASAPYVTIVTFRDGVTKVTFRDGVVAAGGR